MKITNTTDSSGFWSSEPPEIVDKCSHKMTVTYRKDSKQHEILYGILWYVLTDVFLNYAGQALLALLVLTKCHYSTVGL